MEQPEDEPVDDDKRDAGDYDERPAVVEEGLRLAWYGWDLGHQLRYIQTKLCLIPRKRGQEDIAAAKNEEGDRHEASGVAEAQKAVAGPRHEGGQAEIHDVRFGWRKDEAKKEGREWQDGTEQSAECREEKETSDDLDGGGSTAEPAVEGWSVKKMKWV